MILIRTLRPDDLPAGLRLSRQAGWNQTAADWQRFVNLQPDGCFAGVLAGDVVGTVTTCIFDQVAWIGMMLVDQHHRGRGLGTALMQYALDYLGERNVASVRLDATPMGQPLYEKLGFVSQFPLNRYEGRVALNSPTREARSLHPADIHALLECDRSTIGYDREPLLRRLIEAAGHDAWCVTDENRLVGYALSRAGRLADYVGPCIAAPDQGGQLLRAALRRFQGCRVMIDIPQVNHAAVVVARDAGLNPIRELTRMCRGKVATERTAYLWASSGPEKG